MLVLSSDLPQLSTKLIDDPVVMRTTRLEKSNTSFYHRNSHNTDLRKIVVSVKSELELIELQLNHLRNDTGMEVPLSICNGGDEENRTPVRITHHQK